MAVSYEEVSAQLARVSQLQSALTGELLELPYREFVGPAAEARLRAHAESMSSSLESFDYALAAAQRVARQLEAGEVHP